MGWAQVMPLRNSGVNDSCVVGEAIAFAIEGMSRLPKPYRPQRKIDDLKGILDEKPMAERRILQEDARRRIDELLRVLPSAQT